MAADKTFEAYESIAGESLARVTTQPVQHLIGGQRRSSLDGSTFETRLRSMVDRGNDCVGIGGDIVPQPKRQPMHSRVVAHAG